MLDERVKALEDRTGRIEVKLDAVTDRIDRVIQGQADTNTQLGVLTERMATLTNRVDGLATAQAEMRADMKAMAGEFRAEMTAQSESFRADMKAMAGDLRTEMAAQSESFRADMKAMASDLRTEMTAQSESFRADMKAMAGDLRAEMTAQSESFRADMKAMAGDLKSVALAQANMQGQLTRMPSTWTMTVTFWGASLTLAALILTGLAVLPTLQDWAAAALS